jgi:dephospho-CoA kinase
MPLPPLAGSGSRVPLPPLAGMLEVGRHVAWWLTVPGSVLSGVLVLVAAAAARLLWHRWRVPTALSRSVWRRKYLATVYAVSRRPDIRRLDVLAPRLSPAQGNEKTRRLQAAWAEVNDQGQVRVLTLESCLKAGAELVELGIEVKVLHRRLDSEDLTCHLFETAKPADAQAIINQHRRRADKPIRVMGAKATQPYRSNFEREWKEARSLESVVAKMILRRLDSCEWDRETVLRSFREGCTALSLQAGSIDRILPHLAFRASSNVVFIVGQPGSGKSYVRRRLHDQLHSMRIECHWLTDYSYAYRDLLRTVLHMDPPSTNGYDAYPGGAFVAHDEDALRPALRALAGEVRDATRVHEVTLVEFARSDLVAALGEFEAIRCRSQVIHVSAPPEVRLARISRRARPPELKVVGEVIELKLSDDHLLPSLAERKLYATDGIDVLKTSRPWRDRVFEISNGVDGDSHVDQELKRFVERVIAPYRPAAHGLRRWSGPAASETCRESCT